MLLGIDDAVPDVQPQAVYIVLVLVGRQVLGIQILGIPNLLRIGVVCKGFGQNGNQIPVYRDIVGDVDDFSDFIVQERTGLLKVLLCGIQHQLFNGFGNLVVGEESKQAQRNDDENGIGKHQLGPELEVVGKLYNIILQFFQHDASISMNRKEEKLSRLRKAGIQLIV
jgi:hypothetical protein